MWISGQGNGAGEISGAGWSEHQPTPVQRLPDADPRGNLMSNSRTSGDSRRRAKHTRIYSYLNYFYQCVNTGLKRRFKVENTQAEETLAAEKPTAASEPTGIERLSAVGPTTIECFGREPGGPIVLFELNGPNGERISFPIRCGLYAAGGES